MTAADRMTDDPPRRTRLRAADRKALILEAAGRAFAASGDVRGTTIKQIADEAGISEGIIYRHFDSKDELFVQAAINPLTSALQASLDKIAQFDLNRVGPDLQEMSIRYYAETIDAIAALIPLLGLVLFGDPQHAVPFYRDVLAPALDEVRKSWDDAYRRETGESFPTKLSATTHFGAILMLALEQRLGERPQSSRQVAKRMVALEERRLMPILAGALGRRTASTSGAEAAPNGTQSKQPAGQRQNVKRARASDPTK